jgi:hypothetical protein
MTDPVAEGYDAVYAAGHSAETFNTIRARQELEMALTLEIERYRGHVFASARWS